MIKRTRRGACLSARCSLSSGLTYWLAAAAGAFGATIHSKNSFTSSPVLITPPAGETTLGLQPQAPSPRQTTQRRFLYHLKS